MRSAPMSKMVVSRVAETAATDLSGAPLLQLTRRTLLTSSSVSATLLRDPLEWAQPAPPSHEAWAYSVRRSSGDRRGLGGR